MPAMTAVNQSETSVVYVFDDVRVEPAKARITKAGRALSLEPKAYDVLLQLLDHAGELVEKAKLLDAVWRDTFVTENNLAHAVSQLRRALGDSAKGARYIETIPTRGYRFVAPVVRQAPDAIDSSTAADIGSETPNVRWRVRLAHRLRAKPGRVVSTVATVLVGVAAIMAAAGTIGTQLASLAGRAASGADVAPAIRRLAVLPFRNLSNDSGQDYFVDGMTAAIIGELAKVPSLDVISQTSVMQYRVANRSLPQIGRELGVDSIVEGSVLRDADRVRISVNLVDATTDRPMWADSYERPLHGVLTLQAEIAHAVVSQIRVRAKPSGEAPQHTQAIPEAYELFLQGQFHRQQRSPAALARAVESFERALAFDPQFAPALAGLAGAKFERDILDDQFGRSRAEISDLAMQAIALNANLAESQVEVGRVFSYYNWDWSRAESAYRRAIELNPSLTFAYSEYAHLLQALGRVDEAVTQARKAVAIDPRSPLALSDEGRALYRARRFDEAEDRYQRSLALDPGFTFTLGRLLELYLYQRRFTEVQRILDGLEQSPPRRTLLGLRIRLDAATGNTAAVRRRRAGPAGTRFDASVFLALRDYERALSVLETATEQRTIMPFAWADPTLDPVRANTRFARLIARMGLPVERLVALRQ